jgi:peptidoglycan-associated lipoprotein
MSKSARARGLDDMFPESKLGQSMTWLGRVALLSGALCLTQFPDARAFDENEERSEVIGTFNLRPGTGWVTPDARSPSTSNMPNSGRVEALRGADPETRRLFEDAVDDLEAGERESAQRLFEQIVAHAPNSELAVAARRHLAELYSGGDGSLGAVDAAQPRRREAAPLARPQPARAVAAVSAETEMLFISEAGDRVFFGAGSAELGQRARAVLSQQARWLKSHPEFDAVIEGYADDAPLDATRQRDLAAARAESVRQRLIEEGVHAARIEVAVSQDDGMVADCSLPECAAQNRRVLTRLNANRGVRQTTGYGRAPGEHGPADRSGLRMQ